MNLAREKSLKFTAVVSINEINVVKKSYKIKPTKFKSMSNKNPQRFKKMDNVIENLKSGKEEVSKVYKRKNHEVKKELNFRTDDDKPQLG